MDFEQAVVDSEKQLITFAGKSVIYRRGEYSCTWLAYRGSSSFETSDDAGVLISYESSDFIGDADKLVLDEEPTQGPIEPQRGDTICVHCKNITLVYKVGGISKAPWFRYSDCGRNIIRIHTKLIEEK
jgi:hypothetical protein